MVDEIFDRSYRESRGELNRGLDRGFRRIAAAVMTTFETLHRIEWEAPWARPTRARCN